MTLHEPHDWHCFYSSSYKQMEKRSQPDAADACRRPLLVHRVGMMLLLLAGWAPCPPDAPVARRVPYTQSQSLEILRLLLCKKRAKIALGLRMQQHASCRASVRKAGDTRATVAKPRVGSAQGFGFGAQAHSGQHEPHFARASLSLTFFQRRMRSQRPRGRGNTAQ